MYILNDVKMPATCDSCKVYNNNDGELKIAWYNTRGADMRINDVIINLNLTALDSSYYQSIDGIEIRDGSEIADTAGDIQTNIELVIPKIALISTNKHSLDVNIYPNPSNTDFEVDYYIPSDGKATLLIYDILGHEVNQLINSRKVAGIYHESIDVSGLSNGVYTYKFIFDDTVKTGRIVINR